MAAALYFIAMTLLTGFVTPLAEASPLVETTSRFLPLSFVMPTLDAWFFGADVGLPEGAAWLTLQVIASGTVAILAFRRFCEVSKSPLRYSIANRVFCPRK